MSFNFRLPTTGSLLFSDYIRDDTGRYGPQLSEATAQRGRIRAILKDSKHGDGPNDYVKILKTIDDYIPLLLSILSCLDAGEFVPTAPFTSSWRTTLSDSKMAIDKTPRVEIPSYHAELCFVLLTQAFAYTNWASSPGTSENQAADLLCKAAGICSYIGETILPKWQDAPANRPPELHSELVLALSRLLLADAQSISIRKAQGKTSTALLAKLAIGAAGNFESARGLIYTIKSGVAPDLKKYINDGANFHDALAKKYLAMEANDAQKMGNAIAFAKSATVLLAPLSKKGLGERTSTASKAATELVEVQRLLAVYTKVNDSVTFQTVPSAGDLQPFVPSGRSIMDIKRYILPQDTFGPRSFNGQGDDESNGVDIPAGMTRHDDEYAGAGAYY